MASDRTLLERLWGGFDRLLNIAIFAVGVGAAYYAKLAYDDVSRIADRTQRHADDQRSHKPYAVLRPKRFGGALIAIAAVRFFRLTEPRTIVETATASVWKPEAVNVSKIYFHPEHIDSDHYVEFVVTAYNASGDRLTLMYVDGKIGLREIGSTYITSYVFLPSPTLEFNSEFQIDHDNLSQFQFRLRQWLPNDVITPLIGKLATDPEVILDLEGLNIHIHRSRDTSRISRITLPNAIRLKGIGPAEALPVMIVKATASQGKYRAPLATPSAAT